VALEVIAILQEEGLIERGRSVGASFLEGLRRLQVQNARIREVRGRGMLLALEFNPEAGLAGSSVQAALWDRGFIAGGYPAGYPAGTGLRFDPPLTIEESDLTRLLDTLASVLA
jgi:4-aminobutyrate aminotransferase-like enzyme